MKKLLNLVLYMVLLCGLTGCIVSEDTVEGKMDGQNETEIESDLESTETAETVTGSERVQGQEEPLLTIACKRENIVLPEYVFPETVDLSEFEELSYRLFVSWDMSHVDGGLNYWDYGILDKENNTWEKAVEQYSKEMEKVLGYPEELIWENTDEASGRRVERETKERITDISPDGQYYITYKWFAGASTDGNHIMPEIKLYHQDQCLRILEKTEVVEDYGGRRPSVPFGIITNRKTTYSLFDKTEMAYSQSTWCVNNCWNQDATLMTGTSLQHEEKGIIRLYNMESQQCLYSFEQLSEDSGFYIEVHQLVGNKDSGFILFEDPTGVYKLHYPNGEIELIGHYMFNPSLSPDGKYLFYTGPDDDFWTSYGWGIDCEAYEDIPFGVYIKELQTGRTAYIEMDGARCESVAVRWLEDSDT